MYKRQGLFTHAKIATDFTSCFQDCEAVKAIPAGLFANCESAEKFYGTFYSCAELLSVPDELFAGHSKAVSYTHLDVYKRQAQFPLNWSVSWLYWSIT